MTTTAHAQLQQLRSDLMTRFPERRDAIDGALAAVLAGEHVLLLGPPGTAKSALVRSIAQAFGGSYFERLLTKFSTPEELFGPISLKALEVRPSERLRDRADERALGGAGRAEQEDVLAREHGRERAVDGVAALGEAGHEIAAELLQLRVCGGRHGVSSRPGQAAFVWSIPSTWRVSLLSAVSRSWTCTCRTVW